MPERIPRVPRAPVAAVPSCASSSWGHCRWCCSPPSFQVGLSPIIEAQDTPLHGIAFAKGCESPITVGDPYTCVYAVRNLLEVDTAGDTLTFNGLADTVFASPLPVNSGNILPTLTVALYNGGATCVDSNNVLVPQGGSGAVLCTLPSGGGVLFAPFSFYTSDADDPSPLLDVAFVDWADLCDSIPPTSNCSPDPPNAPAVAQATVNTPTPTPTPTPDQHAHPDPHRYADGDADQHAHPDPHRYADGDADQHAHPDPHRYADGDAHQHAHPDADRYPDGDAHQHAHQHARPTPRRPRPLGRTPPPPPRRSSRAARPASGSRASTSAPGRSRAPRRWRPSSTCRTA